MLKRQHVVHDIKTLSAFRIIRTTNVDKLLEQAAGIVPKEGQNF